jgi:hypothetical protein
VVAEGREHDAPHMKRHEQEHQVGEDLVQLLEPLVAAFVAVTVIVGPGGRRDLRHRGSIATRAGSTMSHPVRAVPDSVTSNATIIMAAAGLWPR